jgi:polysaccharide pyruvyl transferase CsaB
LNLGDEAILHGILKQLRASLPVEVTVYTRDPDDTLSRHEVERAVPIRKLSREEARAEVEGLDLLILGGGGILYDRDVEAYLREVAIAHEVGVPVMVYAVSAGPLTEPGNRKLVAEQLNRAAVVTVRDRQGRQLLEEVGVQREVSVTADPALLLKPEPLEEDTLIREGLDPSHRLVGFSVREPGPAAPDIDVEHYHALVANAADYLVERYDADIVFVPMERKKMDVQQSHAVVARMQSAQRATVLKGDYSSGQMLSLVGHFEFAVGMRLHFLIFAALQGVPFVALPYASKVKGFIEELDLEMPRLEHVTTGHLIAHIDRSWDMRDELRAQIQRLLSELQARSRQTNDMAVELLRTSRPRQPQEASNAAARPS